MRTRIATGIVVAICYRTGIIIARVRKSRFNHNIAAYIAADHVMVQSVPARVIDVYPYAALRCHIIVFYDVIIRTAGQVDSLTAAATIDSVPAHVAV